MFSFFEPGYIKEARLVLKNARKLLHYKQDLLSEASLADFKTTIDRLEQAVKERDRAGIEAAAQQLDTQWSAYLPSAEDAGWRENCEVFLVAIVIAIGVRTFFLQPFTIPTGSMQPTLDGIIGIPMADPAPNLAKQLYDFVMRGRNYVNTVAKSDDTVTALTEHKALFFFTYTEVKCEQSSYTIWAPVDTLRRDFHIDDGTQFGRPPTHFHAGDIIARGAVDAGDHVFVDKLSYNLHMPHRGMVFVFSTRGIRRIEAQLREQGIEGSEFYIKRLVGLPGDTLRIDAPKLYINGHLAQEFGIQRIMNEPGPVYRGYSNPNPTEAYFLTSPDATYTVPKDHYFAMGDNSYNSFDSRYWGPVPQENLMGRGLLVYWPFLPHWGLVR
ncbi:MAG TPA: signal peptidase I [Chthoniobacteraceae bacterium]|jgi:signal peptidase I|nr:signal peptidase I [Chthoniobacteraceae bacterium]